MGEVIRLMLFDTKNIFKMGKYHVRGTGGGRSRGEGRFYVPFLSTEPNSILLNSDKSKFINLF